MGGGRAERLTWTPEQEALAREWWPYCERWARARERERPRHDFGSAANAGLWRAVSAWRADWTDFPRFLRWNLRRAAWNAWDKARRERRALGTAAPLDAIDPPTEIVGEVLEARDYADATLRTLSPKLRDVCEEVYRRGHTLPEAAAALGITVSAAKRRHALALERLRA